MDYTMVVVLYLLLLISYFGVYAAIRKGHKAWRYVIIAIYLATGALFTFLLVGEIMNPSEDANIGMGFSIMLMEFVGIAGIIVAVIVAGLRYLAKRK